MKIGFIGLGIMGKPMAKNILKGGFTDLMVVQSNKPSVSELVELGATAGSLAEIAEKTDVIITMLPNSPEVRDVLFGERGLAQHMRANQTVIDMSSINPVDCVDIARKLNEQGINMLDAPVSGGEPKAIDGSLSVMVGGAREQFEHFKSLIETMSASVVYCGEIGAGNTTKLANQMIVASNIQALAESLTLAQKAGVDAEVVVKAISGGLAGSTVMNAKAPMMLSGNDQPGFKIDLHIKDLNNAIDCAHNVGAHVPMTAAVREIFQYLHHSGHGGCDHSALVKYYEQLTGIELKR